MTAGTNPSFLSFRCVYTSLHPCILLTNFVIIISPFMPRQLRTTEDWHNVFYSYIGPYRRENQWIAGLVAMYYGAVILIGSCIMLDNSECVSILLSICIYYLVTPLSQGYDNLVHTCLLQPGNKVVIFVWVLRNNIIMCVHVLQ